MWSSSQFADITTNEKSIQPVFTSSGTFTVNLTAYDEFYPDDPLFASTDVTIQAGAQNVSLVVLNTDSINPSFPNVSTRNLSLLFTTSPTSASYSCVLLVDNPIIFNETIYPNNSIIKYQTANVGMYEIRLNCTFSNGIKTFNSLIQYVEDPVEGLDVANMTLVEHIFFVVVVMTRGTQPMVSFWLNGIQDYGFKFDQALLVGNSSLYSTVPSGLTYVKMNAFNNVSNVTAQATFPLKYPIHNLRVNVTEPVRVVNEVMHYYFGTVIEFQITMDYGTQVSVTAYANYPNYLAYAQNFTGEWTTPCNFTIVYTMPGT